MGSLIIDYIFTLRAAIVQFLIPHSYDPLAHYRRSIVEGRAGCFPIQTCGVVHVHRSSTARCAIKEALGE